MDINRRKITPDEIQESLRYFSEVDIGEILEDMEQLIFLTGKLTVSQRGREAARLAREVRRRIISIQNYLVNYPIEVENTSGQAIG